MSGSALYETFARAPLSFERGEGSWLVTADGERYLDFAGGIAVNSLGHAHPHLVAALTEQAGKLWHVSNLYEIPGQARLGRAAGRRRPSPTRCSSPIPAPRRWNARSRRRAAITMSTAIPSASASSPSRAPSTAARWPPSPPAARQKYLEGFGPKVDGFDQVPFDDIDAAEKAITPETAAILIEPVQGEGGIRAVPDAVAAARCASSATSTACC